MMALGTWFTLTVCFVFLQSAAASLLDISKPADVRIELVNPQHHSRLYKRKVVYFDVHSGRKWPLDIGFYIDSDFSDFAKQLIRGVLRDDIEARTCLTFTEYDTLALTASSDAPKIYFRHNVESDTICRSYIGLIDEERFDFIGQPITLGVNCLLRRGTLIYVIASTLGMVNEITRPDRDQYVDIFRTNFDPEGAHTYAIHSDDFVETHDMPYDYGSVMHHSAKAWLDISLWGDITRFTVLPKDRRYARGIGQSSEFSFYDVMVLNTAYCPHSCETSTNICQNGGFLDPNNCNVCECPDGFGGTDCSDVRGSGSNLCSPTSGHLTAESTASCVTSPRFGSGQSYSWNDVCAWNLRAPAGRRVDAWFEELLLPAEGFGPCLHWVEIKVNGSRSVRGPRYCNNYAGNLSTADPWASVDAAFAAPLPSSPITSVGNEMMVIFKAPDFRSHQNDDGLITFYESGNIPQFKLCYKISSATPSPGSGATTPSGGGATTPSGGGRVGAQVGSSSEEDDDDRVLLVAILVAVLLVVLIFLVLILICCVMQRRKRQPTPPTSPGLQHVQVAFDNNAYAASSSVQVRAIAASLGVDQDKKDPDDLDFSHVGQAPADGAHTTQPEPPPAYEENTDAANVYSYATSNDVAQNRANSNMAHL